MKVLMFGWEFPPFFAGGVGIVSAELSKALAAAGIDITFVMPSGPENVKADHLKLLVADNMVANSKIKFQPIDSLLQAYQTSDQYAEEYVKFLQNTSNGRNPNKLYGQDLINEIYRFAAKAAIIAEMEGCDVIHAHDWVSFPAGIAAKKATGKPLIVHVHITEFDKTGGMHADPQVYAIEKAGMDAADIVIAVSHFIKNRLIHQYFIPEHKIRVVHNAVEFSAQPEHPEYHALKEENKIVLFLGRLTLQKGPDYFVEAARMVLEHDPNVRFVMAGTGDMLPAIIKKAEDCGILDKFIFPGFVTREEGDMLYRMADVFVMPSVSEPFGIVPLEAMYNGTPVIMSKQSGVSEVVQHALKVDFWDVDDIANKILTALHYKTMHGQLHKEGLIEVQGFSWDGPANKCLNIYSEAMK